MKLPGASQEVGGLIDSVGGSAYEGQVIVSEFNKLEGNRYYDTESQTSFEVDHIAGVGFAGLMIWDVCSLRIGSVRRAVLSFGISECRLDVGCYLVAQISRLTEIANPFSNPSPRMPLNITPTAPTAYTRLRTTQPWLSSSLRTNTLRITSGSYPQILSTAISLTIRLLLGMDVSAQSTKSQSLNPQP